MRSSREHARDDLDLVDLLGAFVDKVVFIRGIHNGEIACTFEPTLFYNWIKGESLARFQLVATHLTFLPCSVHI